MKELSIEEKAQAYDKAIERAKNEYQTHKSFNGFREMLTHIFPELQEAAYNDVMREMAIKAVNAPEAQSCIKSWGIKPDDVIAWLEKKGEQKLVEWHREDEQNLNACLGYIPDEFLRRWLMDAIHAKYDNGRDVENPAWSEVDKDMIRYIGNAITCKESAKYLEEKGIALIKAHCWLDSLKPQSKQEWGEEDERLLDSAIWHLRNSVNNGDIEHSARQLEDWLKSIKNRLN